MPKGISQSTKSDIDNNIVVDMFSSNFASFTSFCLFSGLISVYSEYCTFSAPPRPLMADHCKQSEL